MKEYFVHCFPFSLAPISTRISLPTCTACPACLEFSHIVIDSLALIPGLASPRKVLQSPRSIAFVTTSQDLQPPRFGLFDVPLGFDEHDAVTIAVKSNMVTCLKQSIPMPDSPADEPATRFGPFIPRPHSNLL